MHKWLDTEDKNSHMEEICHILYLDESLIGEAHYNNMNVHFRDGDRMKNLHSPKL